MALRTNHFGKTVNDKASFPKKGSNLNECVTAQWLALVIQALDQFPVRHFVPTSHDDHRSNLPNEVLILGDSIQLALSTGLDGGKSGDNIGFRYIYWAMYIADVWFVMPVA